MTARRRRGPVIAVGIYRALLKLLPGAFRRAYAEDAAGVFRERLRSALEERGMWAAVITAARAYGDVLLEGASSRTAPVVRHLRTTTWRGTMGGLTRDARLALRALRRSPRYAASTVLTFAVAIAATTAIYSALDGLLLEPLPFPEPERLVFIGELGAAGEASEGEVFVTSRYSVEYVAEHAETLEGVAAYNIWEAVLTGRGDPTRLSGAVVTWPYLSTLGHPPVAGRPFEADDAVEGAPRRVVISHRLWLERFSGDREIVGSPIELNGRDYEVIGVMPPELETPDEYTFSSHVRARPDIWTVYRSAAQANPWNRSHRGVGRLAPGASLQQARAEVDALRAAIGRERPDWAERQRLAVLPLKQQFTARMRPALRLLLAAVGFVLLTGCVNVMSLVLTRGLDRETDLQVRSALGAGRPALLRQITLELVVLGLLGGVLGAGLGALALEGFLRAAAADMPLLETIRLDPATVGVVVAVTLVVAVLSGFVPGIRLLWGRTSVSVTSGRTATQSKARRRTLAAFAAAQLALALVLMTGAGLLFRSFQKQLAVDPGYDPRGVAMVQLDLPPGRYKEDDSRGLALDRIRERLEADPDVARAGFATTVPQHGMNNFGFGLEVEGFEPASENDGAWARYRGISDGYAETLDLELVRGRFPTDADAVTREEGPMRISAIAVNEEFVARWVPEGEALGRLVDLSGVGGEGEAEIVGIVRNTKHEWLTFQDEPEIFVPAYDVFFTVFMVARAAGDPRALPGAMRRAVRAVDPRIPTDRVFYQDRLLAATMGEARTTLLLMGALAVFALLLSAIGLSGVVSHGVARRAREFGIRLTVGASSGQLVAMVLRQGVRPLLVGAAVGLGLAVLAGRFVERLLFEVEPGDPGAFLLATVVLVAVGTLASWLPARRASRLDPVETLRSE